MSVGDLCHRSVDVTRPDESVQMAARRMLDRNVGSLVVVNSLHQPVGIITDRDLTVRVLADGKSPLETTVADVMSANPDQIFETTAVEEALRVMRSGPYRRLPVIESSGRLVGIVTLDDILDLLSDEFRSIRTLLRHESPDSVAFTCHAG